LNDGRELAADEAYLVRSILNPADDIVEGYAGREIAMPSYQGVLDERGLQSLILYLKSLR
jgi:cytochrome c oxidase subunit 2